MIIENIPVGNSVSNQRFTDVLAMMNVGQSVYTEMKYGSAASCIRAARGRKKDPLKGEFKIIREGNGIRVGRVG